MQYDIYSNIFTVGPNGAALKNYYTISAPVAGLEAATKEYVDNRFDNYPASAFTVNARAKASVMPELRGDGYTEPDGVTDSILRFKLNTTGVIAGSYPVVSVDAKGRVITGRGLVQSDLPSIPYSKLINKPATVGGYGITNALKLTGGTINGSLKLSGLVETDSQLVTKEMVDGYFESGDAVPIGGVLFNIRSNLNGTPYLRTNGAQLNKSTYSALYSVVGDIYGPKAPPVGDGRPWQVRTHYSGTSPQDLTSWMTGAIQLIPENIHIDGEPVNMEPDTLLYSRMFITKNNIFLPAVNDNSYKSGRLIFPLDVNGLPVGTVSSVTDDITKEFAPIMSQPTVKDNRIFFSGGQNVNPTLIAGEDLYGIRAITSMELDANGFPIPGSTISQFNDKLSIQGSVVHNGDDIYCLSGSDPFIGSAHSLRYRIDPVTKLIESVTTLSNLKFVSNMSLVFMSGNYIYAIGGQDQTPDLTGVDTQDQNAVAQRQFGRIARIDISDPDNVTEEVVGYMPVSFGYAENNSTGSNYGPESSFVLGKKVGIFKINNDTGVVTLYSAELDSEGVLGTFTETELTNLPADRFAYGGTSHTAPKVVITSYGILLFGVATMNAEDTNLELRYAYSPFTGGLNDYSGYYDGSITNSDWEPPEWTLTEFRLPTINAGPGMFAYINSGVTSNV